MSNPFLSETEEDLTATSQDDSTTASYSDVEDDDANSAFSIPAENIVIEGHLEKKADSSYEWKKRYMVLHSGGPIIYYNSQQDKDPAGVIHLQNVRFYENVERNGIVQPLDFHIHIKGNMKKDFFIRALDETQKEHWIRAINANLTTTTTPSVNVPASGSFSLSPVGMRRFRESMQATSVSKKSRGGRPSPASYRFANMYSKNNQNSNSSDSSSSSPTNGSDGVDKKGDNKETNPFLVEEINNNNNNNNHNNDNNNGAKMSPRPEELPGSQANGVTYSGYLEKKTDLHRGWKRRYTTLHENALYYYDNEDDEVPVGVIYLSHAKLFPNVETNGITEELCFHIKSSGKLFVLRAENLDSKNEWCHEIAKKIQTLRPYSTVEVPDKKPVTPSKGAFFESGSFFYSRDQITQLTQKKTQKNENTLIDIPDTQLPNKEMGEQPTLTRNASTNSVESVESNSSETIPILPVRRRDKFFSKFSHHHGNDNHQHHHHGHSNNEKRRSKEEKRLLEAQSSSSSIEGY